MISVKSVRTSIEAQREHWDEYPADEMEQVATTGALRSQDWKRWHHGAGRRAGPGRRYSNE
jgi:hypothetical protein